MLTYVINTSENKTFDSDQLFKLVGYNKICWMNYGISDLEKCAADICERQTILGADDFRVAVLIDFYGFDRVRAVYGSKGYSPIEKGVDLSVYFPYIEAYIVDHLFDKIQRKELYVKEKDVFYIQDGKQDGYNVLSNEESQLEYVLEPNEESVTEVISVKVARSVIDKKKAEEEEKLAYEREITEEERQAIISDYESQIKELADLSSDEIAAKQRALDLKRQKQLEMEEEERETEREEVYVDVPAKRYSEFDLYCTENLSLSFKMTDYPYTNKKGLTFHEFYLAFKQRGSLYNGIKRHHYYASFGSGIAKAAFDNLSLYLYLIKMYEREEQIRENSEFVIDTLEPDKLKSMLITAWNKICSARVIALNNSSEYYDIKALVADKEDFSEHDSAVKDFVESDSSSKAYEEYKKLSVEETYKKICDITSESTDSFSEHDKEELNKMMANYLQKRDAVKENVSDYEFRSLKDEYAMTSQCPSKNDYDNVMEKKKAVISEVLTKTVNIEYINKDFSETRKKANKAYNNYLDAKNYLGKSLIADIFVLIAVVAIMIVPFIAINDFNFDTVTLLGFTSGLFGGLYALSFLILILPLIIRLRDAKRTLKDCFIDSRVKQDMALAEYRRRYEGDLIKIENLRYELRHITRLYNYNLAKNKNIEQHRQMLEIVENKLSAMLNNLGVEPVVVRYKNLEDEFDVSKSYMSNDNKIYKIFSIDAIEGLFGGKRR